MTIHNLHHLLKQTAKKLLFHQLKFSKIIFASFMWQLKGEKNVDT